MINKLLYSAKHILQIALYQLWLSVSSVDFYRTVCKSYKGYGIKFIFYLSFISSLFFSIFMLESLIHIKDSFHNGKQTANILAIDHVLAQFPDTYYDGLNISIQGPTPVYLKNLNDRVIAALDPNNTLSYAEKKQIPFVFSKSALVFTEKNGELKSVSYQDIQRQQHSSLEALLSVNQWVGLGLSVFLNFEPSTITSTSIKQDLMWVVDIAPRVFIYLGIPMMVILCFTSILLERLFMVVLVYFLAFILGVAVSIKDSIRLVLFASGVQAILQPIMITPLVLLIPQISILLPIIVLWSNTLLFLALLKLRQEK